MDLLKIPFFYVATKESVIPTGTKHLFIGYNDIPKMLPGNIESLMFCDDFNQPLNFLSLFRPKSLITLILPKKYCYYFSIYLLDIPLINIIIPNDRVLTENCLPTTVQKLYIGGSPFSPATAYMTQIDPKKFIISDLLREYASSQPNIRESTQSNKSLVYDSNGVGVEIFATKYKLLFKTKDKIPPTKWIIYTGTIMYVSYTKNEVKYGLIKDGIHEIEVVTCVADKNEVFAWSYRDDEFIVFDSNCTSTKEFMKFDV